MADEEHNLHLLPRKGTKKVVYLQIFEVKSDYDKYLNKNTGSVSPIKINKNQGDTWRTPRAKQGESTGKVLDANLVVTEWYRSGNEVVSRKKAERSYVYPT